ncbi:uncharacterized protein [Lepeophtheirus salmonis]|uniref:uncharacterized protein isoform X1 n=1 Tax=Lepeophtheirus salmonis TaxID=72036 RepID=UPI001AE9D13F|nr:interaptin-like isoform X1 [Lepeophtheirus salmonis]
MQSAKKNSHRLGVVYDEHQRPDLLYHDDLYEPNKDEEIPLQRPRPPESLVVLREKGTTGNFLSWRSKRSGHFWTVSLLSILVTFIGFCALVLLFYMYFNPKEERSTFASSYNSNENANLSLRLAFLEVENDRIQGLYKDTQNQLFEAKKERDRSYKILTCTHSHLKRLELRDIETKCKWKGDGVKYFLSDESVKQERLKTKENRTLSPQFASRYKSMEDQFESHLSDQSKFCSQIRDSISSSLYERNTDKSHISELLTLANEKVLAVITSMERAASQGVYQEQDWINSQMKSARNIADEQQNYLQDYLTKKILPGLRGIGSSILDQKRVIQEVNMQIDTVFKNQLDRWEQYIQDQKDLNSALFEFLKESESSRNKHLQKLRDQEFRSKEANNILKQDFNKLLSHVDIFSKTLNHHADESNNTVDESLNIIGVIGNESSSVQKSLEKYTKTSIKKTESMVYSGSQDSTLIQKKQNYLVESIEKGFQVINPASELISSESKEFVSKFQDDSNKRYSHFEGGLRRKSETSSEYLQSFNDKTQDVRSFTLNAQKLLESRLESQQNEDAKITSQLQNDIEGQCNALKNFGDSYGKKLQKLGYSTNQMILEGIRQLGEENLT